MQAGQMFQSHKKPDSNSRQHYGSWKKTQSQGP